MSEPAHGELALERLAAAVAARFGLTTSTEAGGTLAAHVESRRRALGIADVSEYARRALSSEDELWRAASAISNGWTWFLRDEAQLAGLAERLARRGSAATIWVAGCSSGEEAYGLAMLCLERGAGVRIVATDLHAGRLAAARRGVYGAWSVRTLCEAARERWLDPIGPDAWRVGPALREVVRFERHNLMEEPPAIARFDAVVCRNVLIYCPPSAIARIVRGLRRARAPEGEIVLGASDTLPAQLVAPRSRPPAPVLPVPERARRETPPPPPPRPTDALSSALTAGHLLVRAHSFDRAEHAYRSAAEIDPCSPELHLSLGVLYRKRGEWERASSALRRTIFLDPGIWHAWALLAGCLARLGHGGESRRALEEALAVRGAKPVVAWRSHVEDLLPPDDELLLIGSGAPAP